MTEARDSGASKGAKLRKNVYQSNLLIQARKGMGAVEMRLFMLGLQGINPHLSQNDRFYDTEFKEMFIPTAKLTEIFGGNTWYLHDLEKRCRNMLKTVITIRPEDGGLELYNLFRKIEYVPAEGLYIHFDDSLRPYLLDLCEAHGYTQIAAEQIFRLTSPYAVRLVELLLQFQNVPNMKKRRLIERTFSIGELRFALNVPDGAYIERIGNFRKSVLDNPIREINAKTPYKMRYEVLKRGGTGGRVYAFKFFLDTSAVQREKPVAFKGTALQKLKSLGFSEQAAQAIRDKCDSDEDCLNRITRATRSLSMCKKRRIIENELGYLRRYIEKNWDSIATIEKKRADQSPPPIKEVLPEKKPRSSGSPQQLKEILRRMFSPPEKTALPKIEAPPPITPEPAKTREPSPNEFRSGERPVASSIVGVISSAISKNEVTQSVTMLLQVRGLTPERFRELYMD